jgi:CheY-like chemotaxis protein
MSVKILQMMLEHSGLKNVIAVCNGQDAVSEIRRHAIDVVFIDWIMPELDGFDTSQLLRETGYSNPIIGVTANPIPDYANKYPEARVDDFIRKPISMNALSNVLSRWLPQQIGIQWTDAQ